MISNSQGTNYSSSSGDDDENISFVVVVVFNEYISCRSPPQNFFSSHSDEFSKILLSKNNQQSI